MRLRSALALLLAGIGTRSGLRAQKPFREYQAIEHENFQLPPDRLDKHEWTRARLKCPGVNRGYRSNLNWTMDYPRSDRRLLQGMRRLTRIDAHSVEQVLELDGAKDDFNWPMNGCG